jgi:hypothetical protein
MAANKVVPGPKDDHYGEPKGTKFEKLYLKKKGWAKNKKNRSKLTASAANNIRRLSESGHQFVIDDNDPRKLKIIKQFKPRA